MTDRITFIHAADLHLDSPFKGFSDVPEQVFQTMRESTFLAFNQLIESAIKERVDFVLLVGDLFDENKQSLKAQLHLREGFIRLQQHDIDVFLSYGNHDYLNGNTYPIQYPDNVHIFQTDEVTSFPFLKGDKHVANLYGFSYVNQDVRENKALQYKISDEEVPYHIALLHGTLHGNQEHDPYAPFRLEDLAREAFDYWALGHIHKSRILQSDPPVIYPGNIQGRHRKETGLKGCYFVTLDGSERKYELLPLQHVEIKEIEIDLTNYGTMTKIKEIITQEVTRERTKRQLIYITLVSDEEQDEQLGLSDRVVELIDIINEDLLEQPYWQYIYEYKVNLRNEARIKMDSYFMEEIHTALQEIDLKEAVGPLYHHPQAKKHLQLEDETEIIDHAVQYLTDVMAKKVR